MIDVKYYECQKCGAIIKVTKPDVDKYVIPCWTKPSECYENQGGCGRTSKFLEVKKSWVENNRLRVDENEM